MKGYTGIAPPKERVFLLIPSGLSLTMVGALGRLFASVIPGGSFSGPTDYSTAASLLLPGGMTPGQAAGHVIAAAELLEEAAPDPAEVEPADVDGALNRMSFEDDALTLHVGTATSEADQKARDVALRLIASFAPYFDENPGAKNYVEYLAWHPETHEKWTLTVRKPTGKTPHQCRQEAEAESVRLRAALTKLVQTLNDCTDNDCHCVTDDDLDEAEAALRVGDPS